MKLFKLLVLGIILFSLVSCEKDCIDDITYNQVEKCEPDYYLTVFERDRVDLVTPIELNSDFCNVISPEFETADDLCNLYPEDVEEFYIEYGVSWSTANSLFLDVEQTKFAAPGWYTDGRWKKYWTGKFFSRVFNCN